MVDEELEQENVQTEDYKCPECGAPMRYDPETESLKCDYCSCVISLAQTSSSFEHSFDNVKSEDASWQNENQVVKCDNCGAQMEISKKEMSAVCPFCGSNQVVHLSEIAGYKPDRVCPFKVSETDAVSSYKQYLKKRFYVPRKIKKMDVEVKVDGAYIPSWTYDANTFSSYRGRLGKRYTVTVGSGKNKHTETRIRYFNIKGTKSCIFDDILINAGTSLSQKEIDSISPYDTNNSSEFKESFLAGFHSEHYTKDVKQCYPTAKEVMDVNIRREILSRYSYDVVDYLKVNTRYDNITYKYVLLPVWIGKFLLGKKNYRFFVNGETGKTSGKYPVSPVKVCFTVFIIILIVAAIILLAYYAE